MITDIMKIQSITIGKRGENNAVELEFDMSEFTTKFPSGTPVIVHQRPGEGRPYVVQGTSYDSNANVLKWTVSNADVGIAGNGYAEIRWIVSGKLKKSAKFVTITSNALADSTTEAPGNVVYMVKGIGDLMNSVTNLGVTEGPDGAIEIFGNGIKNATITTSDTQGQWVYNVLIGQFRIQCGRVIDESKASNKQVLSIPAGDDFADYNFNFPVDFSEAPYVQLTVRSTTDDISKAIVPMIKGATSNSGGSVRCFRNDTDTSAKAEFQVFWFAYGKA